MSIDWGDYEGFDPGIDRLLHEVSRKEAKAYFERYLDERPRRHVALRDLCGRNGFALGVDDADLDELNAWFVEHVEGDTSTSRLESQWYVVVRDIGIWLGDLLIEREPHLEWRMFTQGKTDVAYQRPVVMGFRNVKNPKYNWDPELLVADLGVRSTEGERDQSFFRTITEAARAFA